MQKIAVALGLAGMVVVLIVQRTHPVKTVEMIVDSA